ncbi:MAG: cation transporter [Ferruginibacter sp.]|nr:cation transporter [Bacteroidota bacterium]MBX2919420.1 cation transporter [Ferruginibacter sp.]MCB0708104.1 cation transporter [Chitinophagaceae bacterium]
MKTLSLFVAVIFSILSFNTAFAQSSKTETIKVWGNCGMCKSTIEKAAKKAGAKKADWNEDTKELKVTYAVNKTSSEKIQQSIANSGYDTQDFTAVQSAYDNLHNCCKYDRKADATEATAAVYACPMKCEKDKTYDKPGKCPVCGMDLKQKKDNHAENHQ